MKSCKFCGGEYHDYNFAAECTEECVKPVKLCEDSIQENKELGESLSRIDNIGQNGNDGVHYSHIGESYADKIERICNDKQDEEGC